MPALLHVEPTAITRDFKVFIGREMPVAQTILARKPEIHGAPQPRAVS
jgi:hypothetical protein